jgi:DNA-binding transcriptional LysR family regulator
MSRDISWDDQRIFLAVLETGSLSAAARKLGLTQPTVRARLDGLEQALGVVLFTRSANGLVPTDLALSLGAPAQTMARAAHAFVRTASMVPGQIGGVVRISVAEAVGVMVIPPMIARLRLLHPEMIIEVSLDNGSADLLEQEVDIAVRMYTPKQQVLVAQKVGGIPLGLFAHQDYLARRGTPLSVADLADHDLIGSDRALADLEMTHRLLPDVPTDRFVLRTDSHPAQVAFARAGLGIAVTHRQIGRAEERLRPVLPNLKIDTLETWIVMHEDLRHVPKVRTVFDHLVAELSAYIRGRSAQDV